MKSRLVAHLWAAGLMAGALAPPRPLREVVGNLPTGGSEFKDAHRPAKAEPEYLPLSGDVPRNRAERRKQKRQKGRRN